MTDDRRAALEAIAYGDDVRISPGDRIRALELLQAEPDAGSATALAGEIAAIPDVALDDELDVLTAARVMAVASDAERRTQSPATWRAIQAAARLIARNRPPLRDLVADQLRDQDAPEASLVPDAVTFFAAVSSRRNTLRLRCPAVAPRGATPLFMRDLRALTDTKSACAGDWDPVGVARQVNGRAPRQRPRPGTRNGGPDANGA